MGVKQPSASPQHGSRQNQHNERGPVGQDERSRPANNEQNDGYHGDGFELDIFARKNAKQKRARHGQQIGNRKEIGKRTWIDARVHRLKFRRDNVWNIGGWRTSVNSKGAHERADLRAGKFLARLCSFGHFLLLSYPQSNQYGSPEAARAQTGLRGSPPKPLGRIQLSRMNLPR